MVVLSKPIFDLNFSPIKPCKPTSNVDAALTMIPVVDLSSHDAKSKLLKACEEFGFFKVINHGVPVESITSLESKAVNFFSLAQTQKDEAGPPNPFGYGNKSIGLNGDVGWVEYLLLKTDPLFLSQRCRAFYGEDPLGFSNAVNDYAEAVKELGCEVLELLAEGAEMKQRNALSRLLMDDESDTVLRLNHYPSRPDVQVSTIGGGNNVLGFGEHTDPQIISILRSNSVSGLEISLKDGSWVAVPSDPTSFFILVGDSLQVMSNGRFRSVKHRVMTNGLRPRLSMIYFVGPSLQEKIGPMKELMKEGEESMYKEFTWNEYKTAAYKTRLGDNRLGPFQKKSCITNNNSSRADNVTLVSYN
ncbi:hypothetical protein Sjap_000785 [Stephania japonica]|uniref:gibberellin 2beta-dioxygenase n=1 Tax=Stephania japonica TaxID=461633 RepID=A0AAP0KJR1_9MAGN